MWGEVVLAGLVGGVIALDRTAAFQIMISRPLVAGPIIGLVLGEPVTGILMGAMIELIWISNIPLGGHLPPNDCLSTIIVTAAVILSVPGHAEPEKSVFVLGFLISPPLARAAVLLDGLNRWINGLLAGLATRMPFPAGGNRILLLNLSGMLQTFIVSTVFLTLLIPAAVWLLGQVHPLLPPPVIRALDMMFFIIPLIGVSAALTAMNVKYSKLVFGIMFAGSLILLSL